MTNAAAICHHQPLKAFRFQDVCEHEPTTSLRTKYLTKCCGNFI